MMVALVVLTEVSLALLIILGVVARKALQRRARDRAALNTLVTSIKTQRAARTQKLAEHLGRSGSFGDDEALTKASELIQHQNRFYQYVIDFYSGRDSEALSGFDHRLEELMEQHATVVLTPATHEAETGPDPAMLATIEKLSQDAAAMSVRIQELENENAELHAHIKGAEQELDQLGREYVSAFNRPKKPGAGSGPTTPIEPEVGLPDTEPLPPPVEVMPGTEKRDTGLLEDLNLGELIGNDAGPIIDDNPAKT